MESADEGSTSESASDESAASSDHSDHEHEDEENEQDKTEKEKEREEQDQIDYRAKNPYAGHLENQRISRLTQVQADIVEDSGKRIFFFNHFGPACVMRYGSCPNKRDTRIHASNTR